MSQIKTDIGTRMKRYETVTKEYLVPHTPTIVRIDGKAFHTYTKKIKAERPFDIDLHESMLKSMRYLMQDVMQGAVLGYTQSDEISILLKDFPNLNTEQWFGGSVQKIVSISASAITAKFNKLMDQSEFELFGLFDARVFQLPIFEVTNYFIWRQQDATRNSVQMLGRAHFSHKELHKCSSSDIQDKLMLEKNINWNNLPKWQKRGSCFVIEKNGYMKDLTIPIFTEDRTYIDCLISEEYGN